METYAPSRHVPMARPASPLGAFLLLLLPGIAVAEPRVTLKLPTFPGAVFPNFSSVIVPAAHGPIEIWVEDAVSEIQVSTARIKLNEMPMTPFVAMNPLPRGLRLVVKDGVTMNPEYRLRPSGENLLSVALADESGVSYKGQFYLTVDAAESVPRLAPMRARAPAKEVTAPAEKHPPTVRFVSEWPSRTTDAVLTLAAEAEDGEGLVRLVLEVNGRDLEEVVFQNELPVRKDRGWVAGKKLPGEVTGDSRRVRLVRPVKLDKDIMVVAIRAENVLGLRARVDRTVERVKTR